MQWGSQLAAVEGTMHSSGHKNFARRRSLENLYTLGPQMYYSISQQAPSWASMIIPCWAYWIKLGLLGVRLGEAERCLASSNWRKVMKEGFAEIVDNLCQE